MRSPKRVLRIIWIAYQCRSRKSFLMKKTFIAILNISSRLNRRTELREIGEQK